MLRAGENATLRIRQHKKPGFTAITIVLGPRLFVTPQVLLLCLMQQVDSNRPRIGIVNHLGLTKKVEEEFSVNIRPWQNRQYIFAANAAEFWTSYFGKVRAKFALENMLLGKLKLRIGKLTIVYRL